MLTKILIQYICPQKEDCKFIHTEPGHWRHKKISIPVVDTHGLTRYSLINLLFPPKRQCLHQSDTQMLNALVKSSVTDLQWKPYVQLQHFLTANKEKKMVSRNELLKKKILT